MLSKDRIVCQGNWLFRWRSYLPLVLLSVLIPILGQYSYIYNSHTCDMFWEAFCLGLSTLGLAIRCYTIGHVPRGTSGRNTKEGQIAECLNTTGIYSLLRNPLYLGNFFMMFGVILFLHNFWLSLFFSVLFWVYYERIVCAEEDFLTRKFGQEYIDYANRTPAFIPAFRNWTPSALPFSWKTVLRREYCGLLGMVASFFTLEMVTDALVCHQWVVDPVWAALFALALATFLLLRFLKKYTQILEVEGR